ncbi:MAG: two-component regulator propeller domain-containing protein [Bacteroidota bacterium]
MKKIVVLFLLFGIVAGYARSRTCPPDSTQSLFFNYLSVNNGLSQNSVTSILQDSKGFIWIGTYDGLNRFDGFTTQVKRHESNNPNSLTDNRILSLYEASDGSLLIGTDGGGLNRFDPVKNRFSRIQPRGNDLLSQVVQTICLDPAGNTWVGGDKGITVLASTQSSAEPMRCWYPKALKNTFVRTILRDRADNLWIGTDQGLYLSKADSNLSRRMANITRIEAVGTTAVTALYQDRQRNLWIGKNGDLFRAGFIGDLAANPLMVTSVYKAMFSGLPASVNITHLTEDRTGNFWISSRNAGLFRYQFDEAGKVARTNRYQTEQPFCNLSENSLSTLLVDSSNTLWIGTFQKGANWISLSSQHFYSFHPLMTNQIGELGYKGKYITTLLDTEQELWVGTSNEGLYLYEKCTRRLHSYAQDIPSKDIIALYQDRQGNRWIGGGQGLYKVAKGKRKIETIHTINKGLAIRSIAEDRLGHLWLATWESVIVYNPATNTSQALTTADGLSSRLAYTLYADPFDPVMWVGTIGGGINRIAYAKGQPYHITSVQHQASAIQNAPSGLSNNHVWAIFRDANRYLWVGTDAGLNQFRIDSGGQITHIHPILHPLLKDRKIVSILPDDQHTLWLGSSLGLFRYNPATNQVKQYTYKDGLQSNTLTEAAFRTPEGWLYFGGINGLNYFKPEKIQSNAFPSQTALVDFRIFNQSIEVGKPYNESVILEKDINATEQMVLSYRQNNFLLGFASLHYALPEENRFRYKLEGYDPEWIETGHTQRFAAYSNLDAGQYRFLITSSNNDGRWNAHPKSILIRIEPAPWVTGWAKTLYLLLAVGLVWFLVNYYRTKHQLKNQLFQEKLEKEKVMELNEMKLSFFTNITHELRTPLNLILGPLQDLVAKLVQYDSFTQFRLRILHRNSLRLFTLINQVLDLRKISSENQTLVIAQGNLVHTICEIKDSFHWMAEQKHIRFAFQSESPSLAAWYDSDKVEKVIFNILSNAFQYTPEAGSIIITLAVDTTNALDPQALISIQDSGSGIEQEDQDKVFDLFYQGKKHTPSGSGIGLALSKKLIEMHQGTIRLESTPGKGTRFTVSFPISRYRYPQESLYENEQLLPFTAPSPDNVLANHPARRSVLLVEDHEDLRAYMKECIGAQFRVMEAADGLIGLELAGKHQPDIIITDLMMPHLDGIAFCRKIKADVRTSHIPVLIHSVKNTGLTLQEAMQAGADDFIAKPFDYSMLAIKMHNILASRQQLLMGVYKDKLMSPSYVSVPSLEEELLKKILRITEQNMADPEFNVESLCHHLGMSRMHLHRKLHAIVGKTASEFIREVRMKRSGQLLGSGSKRISEVMYEVGIASNTHFNKYFREMYGVSPKEYQQGIVAPPN